MHSGGAQSDYQIEKQTWTHVDGTKYRIVTNPTACTWDINDHAEFTATGDVAAGSSTSITSCHIWSAEPLYACYSDRCTWWGGADNWISTRVIAKDPAVQTSLCFTVPARCFALTPIYDSASRAWFSTICVHAVYQGEPYDPAFVEVPNSGGGLGVQTDVTLTIAGSQGRGIVRGVSADWGVSSDLVFPLGCPANPVQGQTSYPFVWIGG